MRSLIWVNQFALLPRDGGGTRHFELGCELVRRGWKVCIFASDLHLHARRYTRRAGEFDRATHREIQDGVEIRWLWASCYERNDWRRAWNWLTFYRSVVREARELQTAPDIVIGSSPQIFAAVAGRSLARRARVPFVFEVRDLWPESLVAAGGRRGVSYTLIDSVARGLYRDADRVLVLARGTQDYLEQHGVPAQKMLYVPNGVDVDAIQPADSEESASGRPLTFVYAGAHGPANGLDRVLDAAEILGPSANVRFLLIGDGPVKAGLRASASRRGLQHVEFHDPVSKSQLAALLARADAGLMVLREAPLFSFGVSPNKLFDYLAAGLPVVCNVPGEVAQMLSQAHAGVQAADASAMALAEAVSALAGLDARERRERGRSGRDWVERTHSRQILASSLENGLANLITP